MPVAGGRMVLGVIEVGVVGVGIVEVGTVVVGVVGGFFGYPSADFVQDAGY